MTRKRPSGLYDIGYAKPPTQSQFKPGKSGNPHGRPRKLKPKTSGDATDHDHMLVADAKALVTITVNGKKKVMTTDRAIALQLAAKALKGDLKASGAYLAMVQRAQIRINAEWDAFDATLRDYRSAWFDEKSKRAAMWPRRPEPALHPDEIVAHRDRGVVIFNGPKTDDEAHQWRTYREAIPTLKSLIDGIDDHAKAELDADLSETRSRLVAELKLIDALYPDERTRRAPFFDLAAWRLRHLKALAASDPPTNHLTAIRDSGVIAVLSKDVANSTRGSKISKAQ